MCTDTEVEYEFDTERADAIELGLDYAQKVLGIARENQGNPANYDAALTALTLGASSSLKLLRGLVAAHDLIAALVEDATAIAYPDGADALAEEAAEPVGVQ